jgi:hypothetical protein
MTQEINRRLHEALGRCWHERPKQGYDIPNIHYDPSCPKCGANTEKVMNPDYCSDPRLAIEAMQERDDWDAFMYWQGFCESSIMPKYWIPIDLMMDTTGNLALLAIEWLERRSHDLPLL